MVKQPPMPSSDKDVVIRRKPVREARVEPVWVVHIDGVVGVTVFRSFEGARQTTSQHFTNSTTQWISPTQIIVHNEDGKAVAVISHQQVFP